MSVLAWQSECAALGTSRARLSVTATNATYSATTGFATRTVGTEAMGSGPVSRRPRSPYKLYHALYVPGLSTVLAAVWVTIPDFLRIMRFV